MFSLCLSLLQCVLVLEQSLVDVAVVLHDNARLLYARRNRSDRLCVKQPSRVRHVVFFGVLSWFGSVSAYSNRNWLAWNRVVQ